MLIAPMRDAGDAAGELLAGISDRLVDNVNTLAHLLNRDRPALATVPDRPPAHS
jgi:hypothetical protein